MIKIVTSVPGPKSLKILSRLKEKNGGWSVSYPLVFSGGGHGPFCEDIDGNVFLDFASQVASNPLGYNHPDLIEVVKSYNGRFPVKFAGQDFAIREHLDLIESLLSVAPGGMDAAFLINSGAEAVENAIKICMRKRPGTKFGISMESGWHGRTLGALSLTNSSKNHKKGYMRLPAMRLPYDDSAGERLERILRSEASADEIGFIIVEHVQGEGGYNIASGRMVSDVRRIAREHDIPYIADEVQAGMGRTGSWWAFENFGIVPDVFTCAKALQVGAVVSKKSMFPEDPGAISSTWGGGHILDLALGMKTIEVIRREKLVERNARLGKAMLKRLSEIKGVLNPRGLGLMLAIDFQSKDRRDDVIVECSKRGLLLLGCGRAGIRLIPPYIIDQEDAMAGLEILEDSIKECARKGFAHKGAICDFIHCGTTVT